jgi:hypothetical protein
MNSTTIRVYRFGNPAFLVKDQAALLIYLGMAPVLEDGPVRVVIDAYTGHFALADNTFEAIEGRSFSQQVPQAEAGARKAVEQFLAGCERRRTEHAMLTRLRFPNLFSNILFSGAQPVLDLQEGMVKQWELRYQPHVVSGTGQERVPVLNSGVTFRIGPGGRLVGLVYDWMPIESGENVPQLWPTLPANARSSIVYMIEPGQHLCAPYLVGEPKKEPVPEVV